MIKAIGIVFALVLGQCEGNLQQANTKATVASVIDSCVSLVPPQGEAYCDEWDAVNSCLGATETEKKTLRWINEHESDCGRRMHNPDSSDTGVCQLNGIHGKRADQLAVARFGLTPYWSLSDWRSNSDTPLGNARIAAYCLYLLRSSDDGEMGNPDTFKGCSHWSVHKQIKRRVGCGVA